MLQYKQFTPKAVRGSCVCCIVAVIENDICWQLCTEKVSVSVITQQGSDVRHVQQIAEQGPNRGDTARGSLLYRNPKANLSKSIFIRGEFKCIVAKNRESIKYTLRPFQQISYCRNMRIVVF